MTAKRKKPIKDYVVNVDMKYSIDYHVKARTAGEAKKKAWNKHINRPPRKLYDLMADTR